LSWRPQRKDLRLCYREDITTGEILCCDRGNHLKRSVALTKRVNKEMFGVAGQWRFCHDFGKKWIEKGAPTR
jgi:hypothetical protein